MLAKIGKYFPKLMRVLDKLLDLAKKLPGGRGIGRYATMTADIVTATTRT